MGYRSISKSTNINEIEDLATEAANCPKEHVIKHFMLEACSYHQKQKMRPYLLLPMREFKFKLKMVVQEEQGRFSGNNNPAVINQHKVRAINCDDHGGASEVSEKRGNQATTSTTATRELKTNFHSGNAEA